MHLLNFYVVLRFVPVGVKFLHNFSLKNSDLRASPMVLNTFYNKE